MSKNKNTKKALEKLKVKRAKYEVGGYGYGGERNKSDSVPYTPPSGGPQDTATNNTAPPPFADPANPTDAEIAALTRYFETNPINLNLGAVGSTIGTNTGYFSAAGSGTMGTGTNPAPTDKKITAPPLFDITPTKVDTIAGYGGAVRSDTLVKTPEAIAPQNRGYAKLSAKASVGSATQGKTDSAKVSGVDSEADQYADKYIEQYPEWNETQKVQAREWAYSQRAGGTKKPMPSWLMNSDFLKGLEVANKMSFNKTERDATTYDASKAGDLTDIIAAEGDVSKEPVAGGGQEAEASKALKTERDKAAEEAAKGTAVDRPAERDYATGVTSDDAPITIDQTGITDPTGTGRDAEVMSDEEQKDLLDIVSEEGVDLTKLPNYAKLERNTAVGVAQTEIAEKLGTGPPLDAKTRLAITGVAPKGDAAQIGGIPTAEAAIMNAITGPARNVAAQDMMEVIADMSPEVTAAISQNPATVPVRRDDGADPKTIAAIAALPVEALVSTQMENLLSGIEENKTPLWARPAVDAVNQMMAQRGLTASSVGRDALFNAIIQSALPMAQSNAQALQQRAQQNLSNQQQANLSTAQNVMQIRMQNLANEQTSASQTAQMSQQIKIQQGTFDQQAVLTTAQQTQETNMTNAKMAQQRASQESAQKQQAAISTLGAEVQADLANLQFLNEAESKNMTASQQSKLATYNAQVAKVMRQADLKQNMELAELSGEQQVELANLAEQNSAARESMTAENQERFAKYNTLVDFKKTNVSLAQQMKLANLTNEQQMELANLSEESTSNSADFNEASKVQLQRLTIYTNMMAKNEDLRQNAEMAKLSASEKVQLANLTFQNQADSESLSAKNMAELQRFEKKMAAGQVNAQLAQQMGLANLSNQQSAAMFNAQVNANFDMSKMSNEQQMEMANSKFMQTMTTTKFSSDQQTAIQNATALTQVDLANADARTRVSVENAKNFLTMDMANLNNEQQGIVMDQQIKQQALLSDQAATNAAKQFGATSQNQIDQFMIGQANAMSQFNSSSLNAMSQFNASEKNKQAATQAGLNVEVSKLNAQLSTQTNQFNAQIEFQRDQWNAANAQAVKQSNVTWRRQANTIDTAAQNAANATNSQMAFNLSSAEQEFLWQNLRDEAAYVRTAYENEEQRKTVMYSTALQNEAAAGKGSSTTGTLLTLIGNIFT